jgi:prephenate dehydrogenase
MKTAAIFGLGLIGGSFAHTLRDNGFASEILGVDTSLENARRALELGIVDRIVTFDEAVAEGELIVLATPVDVTPVLATRILNRIGSEQVVMDVGSIKEELCEVISQHPNRGRFVATHPMWGTEFSGPEAAQHGAFTGRTTVVCDREQSDTNALALVEGIYSAIGSPMIYMSGAEQDMHTAHVSHISHITSFALALTVLEKEREEEHIFDLAGGGFESTVRLAKSSPETWLPIFLGNKYNVLDVLREHIHQLQILRKMIEKDDKEGLTAAMRKANTITRILK